MLAETYKIKKRIVNGVTVIGYELESSSGQIIQCNKRTVNEMALNNQILGCKAQRYRGDIIIKGVTFSLKNLPKIDISNKNTKQEIRKDWRIVQRIMRGNRIQGYVLENSVSNERKALSKDDTIAIILTGVVSNARVQKNNGKYIIRGVNCSLDQLEVIDGGFR